MAQMISKNKQRFFKWKRRQKKVFMHCHDAIYCPNWNTSGGEGLNCFKAFCWSSKRMVGNFLHSVGN